MLKRKNKRFEVLDVYDYVEVLYVGNDMNEAYAAACQRFDDTDGECDVYIKDYSRPNGYIPVMAYGEDEE